MKLADRIRLIAGRDEYAEFVALWTAFDATGRAKAGDASRMIQFGNGLYRFVSEAALLWVMDGGAATPEEFEAALQTVLPELAAYIQFVERSLHVQRPTTPTPIGAE